MKLKTLILSAALIAMPFAASGADLPVKTAAARYAPAYNWSGFYIGANIGWLSGTSDITDQGYYDSGATTSLKTNGFAGGGQAGYNWQMGSFVTGVEVDGVGISAKKSFSGYYADYSSKWNSLVTL